MQEPFLGSRQLDLDQVQNSTQTPTATAKTAKILSPKWPLNFTRPALLNPGISPPFT
jgi:hypothetical protein